MSIAPKLWLAAKCKEGYLSATVTKNTEITGYSEITVFFIYRAGVLPKFSAVFCVSIQASVLAATKSIPCSVAALPQFP